MLVGRISFKLLCAQLAQSVEQETENFRVAGSIPALGMGSAKAEPFFMVLFVNFIPGMEVGELSKQENKEYSNNKDASKNPNSTGEGIQNQPGKPRPMAEDPEQKSEEKPGSAPGPKPNPSEASKQIPQAEAMPDKQEDLKDGKKSNFQPSPQAEVQPGPEPGPKTGNKQAGGSDVEGEAGSSSKKAGKKTKAKRKFWIYKPNAKKMKKDGVRLIWILLGTFIQALSIVIFTDRANLLPGGFAGLALLIQRIVFTSTGKTISFTLLNLAFNLVPGIMAYKMVGKKFVLFSFFGVFTFSIFIDSLPHILATEEMILILVFGAVLFGLGSAILMNGNASGGGTDFIAMIVSEKYNFNFFPYTFLINAAILLAAIPYYGVTACLYSVIYQFLSIFVFNRFYDRYRKITLLIIVDEPEPIATDLMAKTHHGVTVFNGLGAYSGKKKTLLYMVVGKGDMPLIRHYLRDQDCEVFMNTIQSDQLEGNFYIEPLE